MKIGKVPQTVLKRSMLKPLQFHRDEALFHPSVEEMCYGVRVAEGEHVVATTTVLYGNEKDLCVFALAQAINDLASRGGKAVGVSIHIMLPPYAYESRLKSMVEYAEAAAKEQGIEILNAKAEVSPATRCAIVSVNAIGIVKDEELVRSNMAKAGQDIVLLKWIGLDGTLRIMREKEEELKERFVPGFLHQAEQLKQFLFSPKELKVAEKFGVSSMHQITSGGVFAALWELCESANIGMEVELQRLAIRQETIEICEFFHLNPYQLTSVGSVLITTDNGEELVDHLSREGIPATLVGKTTKEKAKVILGGEEKRFLDRPAPDELVKIFDIV